MPGVTHHVPMTVKRRGVEMRLVIDGHGPASPKADPILLKAIARARGWFDDLVTGRALSLAAIAAREGITDRYVSHLLPLAFLAPDIVEAISVGRQPVGLTVEALVRRIDSSTSYRNGSHPRNPRHRPRAVCQSSYCRASG